MEGKRKERNGRGQSKVEDKISKGRLKIVVIVDNEIKETSDSKKGS